MSDLVSRAEVKRVLREVWVHKAKMPIEADVFLAFAMQDIEDIPSAETVQKWIPVSERLPDSDRPVLVTIQWTDFDREVTVGEYWDNPTKAAPESEKGWGTYGDHVTAWREMPDPYERRKR